MKHFIIGATAACLLSPLALNSTVMAQEALTIGSSLGYAPFEFTDEKGDPTGFDIDLAKAAADVLGKELKIEVVPFSAQIPSLASQRINIAWSSFTINEERLAQVDFVTFLTSGAAISVLPANLDKYKGPDDVCGITLSIQVGAAADQRADVISAECEAKGLKPMTKQYYPENQDTIQAVLTGRVDATLGDATAASYFSQTSKGQLAVAPFVFSPTLLGLAVRKGDKETATMMQGALQKLIENGTYAATLEKYNLQSYGIDSSKVVTTIGELN